MEPREYNIKRHPDHGYGFIAGNDKPTIVKLVDPHGPSHNRLLPGDVIMAVNGINVEDATREEIIRIIQRSYDEITITVRHVVMRIFFETGSTKVLNYIKDTTVGDLLQQLNSKLIQDSPYAEQIKRYFGIVLTVEVNNNADGKMRTKKLHVLDENDSITKLQQLEYATSLRLIYRMIHPPTNIRNLYTQDKKAFDYLYQQCCNDLRLNRFRPELDEESSLKLSALHILEHVLTHHSKEHKNSEDPKIFIDLVKSDPGLKHFVSVSLADKMTDRKSQLLTSPFKKLKKKLKDNLANIFEEYEFDLSNQNIGDQVRIIFLETLSKSPCYGNSERQPVRTSPSSISSSLDRTSDSLSLIRQDDSTLNQIESEQFTNQYDNRSYISSRSSDRFLTNNNTSDERYPCNLIKQTTYQRSSYSPKIFASSIDETIRRLIIQLPPPVPAGHENVLMRVLSDEDIDKLRCPPLPPMKLNMRY